MPEARTRTFRSGNSEAVRLPKGMAYGGDIDLVIMRSGNVITMYPATVTIPEMVAQLATLPSPQRVEQRDIEPLAERDGL